MFASYGSYQRGMYSGTVLWVLWFFHVKVLIFWISATTLLLIDHNGVHGSVNGVHALMLSLQAINFAAEPLEMVLWSYHLLEPWLYLTLQGLKALMWTVFLPAGVIIIRKVSTVWPWVHILLFVFLGYAAFWFYVSLGYSVYIFMRHVEKTGYQLPSEDNAKDWRSRRVSGREKTVSRAYMVRG